ncbi:MAG TPA: UPF0182 family protein [Candidatus Dormibacteraeota bacterium]|nr:UPF0182 family protein [Candidatus Dormibacteraeota bacterium]
MGRRYRPFDPFERNPFEGRRDVQLPRIPRRFWTGVALFALAVLIFVFASPVIWFFTQLQWYDALGYRDVFTTRLGIQSLLFFGSLVVSFLYLAVNVVIALRVRAGPALRAVGISRSSVRSGTGVVALVASAIIALLLSGGTGAQWQSLALFAHYTATGSTDPVLGQDVAFYLLTLPFLHTIGNWALGLDFLAFLLITVLYAWRGDAFDLRFTPTAISHLSVLMAAFAVTLAATAWLGRFDLLFAHNTGVVWGASYADVNARLPLYTFQAGVGIVLAGALLANAWLRRLAVGVAAVGVWIGVGLIGQIYPGIVQSFFVTPNAQTYELPYIAREISGTRAAYGLSNVTVSNFSGDQPLSAQDVQADQVTINNLRLWDYGPLTQTYDQQQTIRTYYTFNDIDLDRYTVNGNYQQLEISAREFDYAKLPPSAQNWVNQHLVYTHGYGAASSPVNAVVGEGLPDYVVGNIPPTGSLAITQPAIYFGEVGKPENYALAPSNTREFDYPQGTEDVFTSYTGKHGVPMDGANKALWSLRLGDFNLLVSGQINSQTQLLYLRSIKDRVSEIAPFLSYDSDPYIVVVDGKLYWILDGYTTGSTYPYSQTQGFQGNDINYIRNSVKVVVDAYDGTVTFYALDTKDPLLKAYSATFSTLFRPIDTMPANLRAHLRVPVDLFNTQVGVYATYHITDPKVFFSREDVWDIPTAQNSPSSPPAPVEPYYVLFRLPGEQNAEFLLIMPFTPRNKNNMVSWMAARMDGTHYGEYVTYALPKDKVIFGPQQVANRINENTTISTDFTLFHQAGSQVLQGNLLVVPIGNSFLYFEPIYLGATTSSTLPELIRVVLVDQDKVAYANTLQQAIAQLVGSAPPPPPTTNQPPPTTFTPAQVAQIQSLIAQANDHYRKANAALAAGDFATYGSEMKQVGQILQQLQQITGTSAAGGATTPTPAPKPSPSPSP